MRSSRCSTDRVTPGRLRGPALALAVLAALSLFLVRLDEVAVSSWTSVTATGPASPDDAMAALAATAGLALTGWLVAAIALSVVAAGVGNRSRPGRAVHRVTRRVAPVVLRNAVAATLGVVVVASPAVAHAAAGPASTPAPVAMQVTTGPDLSPSWPAPVDERTRTRPEAASSRVTPGRGSEVGDAGAGSAVPVDHPGPTATDELGPGWIPIRPLSAPAGRSPRPTAPVASAPRRTALAETGSVVVRRGDTLWSIAARHLGAGASDAEVAVDWPRWFAANRAVIGSDPDRLLAGERLRPPSAHNPGAAR